MEILRAVAAAVFPSRCTVCGALDAAAACAACTAALSAMGSPAPRLVRACWMHAAFPYQWPVRELVIAGKRQGGQAGLRLLATLAAERVVGGPAPVPVPVLPDLITAVPLARGRERWRGFNQAGVIALAFAAALGVPVAPLLERPRDTGTQVGRRPEERAAGLHNAFRVPATPPPRVWIVDDVLTTGATLGEAAAALRCAGARQVTGIALAAAAAA